MSTDTNDTQPSSDEENSGIVGASSLGRNTSFVLVAELSFSLGRMLTFVLLGRALGTEDLGRYVAVLGLTQLLFPLARVGSAHLMVRSISRGEPFGPQWAKATSVNLIGGVVGAATSTLIALVLFDVSPITTVLIGLAQLIGLGLQQNGGMAAAAHGRAQIGLAINGVNTVFRVVAILIFFYWIDDQTVDVWAWFLAATMLAGSISTLTIVRTAFGARPRFVVPNGTDLRMGSGFVFVDFANTAQADIDKVVLGGFGLNDDAGVYAAAYRVADLANLPLGALVRASYSEFFRRGSDKISEAVRYAKKLTTFSFGYGVAVGIGLWVFAPLLEFAMGDQFAESVTALRWVSFVPALRALQVFPANVLSGTDRQWLRAKIMSFTAALNLVSNIVLVPEYGWRGAAISTLLAEAVFSIALWIAVTRALAVERAETAQAN